MGRELPIFSLDAYGQCLKDFRLAGYELCNVSCMRKRFHGKVVYLRHDIDIDIGLVGSMATLESSMGISSTYFVSLTNKYNLLCSDNHSALKNIVSLGHEIGLHYDLETYPEDAEKARKHLDWEVGILERLSCATVASICLHQPHLVLGDIFVGCQEYIHPHAPDLAEGLLYVSDSCRAWRDENLLTCFSDDPPERVLFGTHPELWLDGTISDRYEYLQEVLLPQASVPVQQYLSQTVQAIWRAHSGVRAHDEREAARKTGRTSTGEDN